ncbi:MAG: hypothetical protein C0601_07340 [Candidatus Muiribacterium halophilum]|uniref:Response regulatory domain-containing protein n=1 Tax=Muiribacterium halophilum TaxID=2053465 RepID=A0A2N5ZG17_MUIH1|nr:MAG: hypothetical protein C0601_07340 [Candidatus Muirbacterium halophilum]
MWVIKKGAGMAPFFVSKLLLMIFKSDRIGFMKIYILDDKDYYVNILKERFEKMGYVVIGNTDPFQALGEITQINDIDLLILDYNMPLINGLEFITKLQRDKDISNIKILVMANDIPENDIIEIKKYASNIIFKPFILSDLLENIEFIFGKENINQMNSRPTNSEISTFKKIIEDMRSRIDDLEKEIREKNIRLEEKDLKILQYEEKQKLFIDKINELTDDENITEKLTEEIRQKSEIIKRLEEELLKARDLMNELKNELTQTSRFNDYEFEDEGRMEDFKQEKMQLELKNDYLRAYIYHQKGDDEKSSTILRNILKREPGYGKAERLLDKIQ